MTNKIVLTWDEFYKVVEEQQRRFGYGLIYSYRYDSNIDQHSLLRVYHWHDMNEIYLDIIFLNNNTQPGIKYYPSTKVLEFLKLNDLRDLTHILLLDASREIKNHILFRKNNKIYISFEPVLTHLDLNNHFLKVLIDVLG